MTEKLSEDQKGLSVYATSEGIALEVVDNENRSVVMLTPDDAGRLSNSLLTTSIVYQISLMMQAAKEAAEFEQARAKVMSGAGLPNVPDLSKLK